MVDRFLGEPCTYCGVRPDVPCKHRPVEAGAKVSVAPPPIDGRKVDRLQGLAFAGKRKKGRPRIHPRKVGRPCKNV